MTADDTRTQIEESREICDAATPVHLTVTSMGALAELRPDYDGNYGRADADRLAHSWNTLPLRNAQVEAALKWAEKHAARACGESLRRAIEEAGA